RARQSSNADRRTHHAMKRSQKRELRNMTRLLCILPLTILVIGCNDSEREKEPVVSVQVETPQKGSIEQTVSAEAVIYPFQQAVITPKITSTIKEFRVHRGSSVRKGQILAILENADLSAAAQQSKGEFEQAEAGYTTTTKATLPQEI